ncbi:HAD-IIB family hydrolase [Mesoplasma photuris]|uniref:HAD-IIB family hydrolase n=1 Tax=Mesoplasma photuris TaxID=217731 RepID=UPI0004E227CC|nr:HAD-IIB family hydrolase [Mesoplasma photuris]
MKWFITDFDGTLRNSRNNDLKLNPHDEVFIKKIVKSDNKLVIATARPHMQIKAFLKKNYNIEPDYLICNNGTIIVNKKGDLLHKNSVSKEGIVEMCQKLKETDGIHGIVYNTPDKEGVLFHTNWTTDLTNAFFGMTPDNGKIEDIIDLEILSIRIMSDISNKYIFEEFNEADNDLNFIFSTSDNFLNADLTSKDAHKGSAIRVLQQIAKFDDQDVLVAGDDYNDLTMFAEFYENSYIVKQEHNKNIRDKANNVITQIHEIVI